MKQTELISTIIEAEQQAQALAAEAKRKKLHLREDLQVDAENLRKRYIQLADERIQEVLAQENEYTDTKIQEANEIHRVEMEAMEKLYSENRAMWIEKIYTTVVDPS
ncbi:MAG: hypothetical protein LBI19_08310 [Oscillospiraceae bacterium]|nr:hypothetical protein [Oscillospiraceae bacterium]